MNSLVNIENTQLEVKEYRGQRVVTFKDIDMVHGRPEGTARKRFADNRNRFIEGEDYFVVKPQDLENAELSEKRTLEKSVTSNYGTALITEQGYLMLVKSFTDDLAWQVQRKLVNGYFRTKQIVNEELSPQTQLILQLAQSIANKELEDKERDRQIAIANETARKAVETTERIKEEFVSPFENWRDDVNAKVREIAIKANMGYQQLFSQMYTELEMKAGCDLATRQRNKRERMTNSGCTKTEIEKSTTKIAIIEDDKKLKQIFDDIVRRYAVKYVA